MSFFKDSLWHYFLSDLKVVAPILTLCSAVDLCAASQRLIPAAHIIINISRTPARFLFSARLAHVSLLPLYIYDLPHIVILYYGVSSMVIKVDLFVFLSGYDALGDLLKPTVTVHSHVPVMPPHTGGKLLASDLDSSLANLVGSESLSLFISWHYCSICVAFFIYLIISPWPSNCICATLLIGESAAIWC